MEAHPPRQKAPQGLRHPGEQPRRLTPRLPRRLFSPPEPAPLRGGAGFFGALRSGPAFAESAPAFTEPNRAATDRRASTTTECVHLFHPYPQQVEQFS